MLLIWIFLSIGISAALSAAGVAWDVLAEAGAKHERTRLIVRRLFLLDATERLAELATSVAEKPHELWARYASTIVVIGFLLVFGSFAIVALLNDLGLVAVTTVWVFVILVAAIVWLRSAGATWRNP